MDVAATQYILGVRPTMKGLVIDPSIPSEWKGFSVERTYRGSVIKIEVSNPQGVQHGVKSIWIDGREIEGNIITPAMLYGKENVTAAVIMG